MRQDRAAVLALTLLVLASLCPILRAETRQEIRFPDLPGHETLVCDLHMHTVFSDGNVWPTVRVEEAWRQGLDVIAITDHVEYQPHKEDVPTNHNRPYELAAGSAKAHGLLLVRGAEITRDTPPGHFNAVFLRDVNPLDAKDFLEVIEEVNDQGAFLFWNHQGWKGEEKGRWMDVHTTMLDRGWLHGMEVCNGGAYYPSAHKWCLEKNLTMMGTSDIHAPDLRKRSAPDDHRTLTLVFAKERTLDSVHEALKQGRTVVWFSDQLIGRQDWLEKLFQGCVRVEEPHLRTDRAVYVHVRNLSDVDVHLKRSGEVGPAAIELPAGSTSLVKIGTGKPDDRLELRYTVTNFLIAPGEGLPVKLEVPGP